MEYLPIQVVHYVSYRSEYVLLLVTARIRRTGEGNVFSLFTSGGGSGQSADRGGSGQSADGGGSSPAGWGGGGVRSVSRWGRGSGPAREGGQVQLGGGQV